MNTLFVILGPTGVGKTDLSIEVARMLGTSVISCDSRQIYRELSIGVASPSPEQLSAVKHYFIATRSVEEHYSAGQYELDALPIIESEIAANGCAVMVGGSMLYIDAVCRGIDDIPTIDEELRRSVRRIYDEQGIEEVRRRLRLLDPQHYAEVDLRNVKRRSFDIVKIGLDCPREVLYDNIDRRVLKMIQQGLEREVRAVSDKRHLNALNTVGYKEMFAYLDGEYDLDRAIELIQRNTRHYAKKQLSWFKRYGDVQWFSPYDRQRILDMLSIRH